MKSTGLFGKNSGRVGGIVYSNYRGEQVVRSYQPKVANPNSAAQVAQRAKFKLVSQVSASLKKELGMSFIPSVAKETPRNAFVKEMLKKTTYSNNNASLQIEEIVLTNSRTRGFITFNATSQAITGVLSNGYTDRARVRFVLIGYNDGEEITIIHSFERVPQEITNNGEKIYQVSVTDLGNAQGYTNVRILAYVYEPDLSTGTRYEEYEILGEEAQLSDTLRLYPGKVNFSATTNVLVPQNV